MNTNMNGFNKLTLDKTASDICDLLESIGFTSEYPIDQRELRDMIVGIICENLDKTPVLITGIKDEPIEHD